MLIRVCDLCKKQGAWTYCFEDSLDNHFVKDLCDTHAAMALRVLTDYIIQHVNAIPAIRTALGLKNES